MEEHKLDIVFRLSATFISTNIVPITAQTKQKITKRKRGLTRSNPSAQTYLFHLSQTNIPSFLKKTVGVWGLVFLGRLTECKVHSV